MYEIKVVIDSHSVTTPENGKIQATGVEVRTLEDMSTHTHDPRTGDAVELGMALAFSRVIRDMIYNLDIPLDEQHPAMMGDCFEDVVNYIRFITHTACQDRVMDMAREQNRPDVYRQPENGTDWNAMFKRLMQGNQEDE